MPTSVVDDTKEWVLTPADVPRTKRKYELIIEEFWKSGVASARVEGPLADSVKPGTLVTSLSQAKNGKAISVHRVGDDVYLKRKS